MLISHHIILEKSWRMVTGSALVLSLVLGAGTAKAQSIPGSADASRVPEHIEQTMPRATVEAPVEIEGQAPFTAPEGAEKITFTLTNLVLEGQTVYAASDIEKIYAGKIGTKVSLAEIYSIAAQLTAKYRNDGYILTQVVVPPQTIADGMVKLRIVEGKINNIRIEDRTGAAYDVIGMYAERLKTKSVLNNQDLERVMLLINDLPGVTARGILSPAQDVVGASNLTVIVDRDPFDAQIGLDNYGSRYLGRWEATGNISTNSLLGLNELLSLNLAYAPSNKGLEPELTFGEALAQFPVGPYGTKLMVKAGVTQTSPGASLDQFDVKGHAKYIGVNIFQPIIRTRDLNLSSSLAFDSRDTRTKSNIDTTRKDSLRIVRLGSHLDWVDTVFNAAVTNVNVEFSHGVSWLGANEKDDLDMSRPDGDPQFYKVTSSFVRLERIVNNVALQTSLSGQMSNGPLLSAEEYGVGGVSFGRGYDPSELVGDDGFGASVELQWNRPYTISWMTDYTVYGFYDFGRVWNDDATTSDGSADSLASIGLGIRTTIAPGTDAGFMIAKPLTHMISSENDDDIRPFFNINHKF